MASHTLSDAALVGLLVGRMVVKLVFVAHVQRVPGAKLVLHGEGVR
jgi:hypothetical protein